MTKPRPNLFIIGAMKSGTTSLYAYLNSHPQIYMSEFKEPEYFAKESVELLKPIQTEQVAVLSKMLGRQFPEWKTLSKSS